MQKKIAIIFTGGTISMKVDPRIAAAIPSMSSEEIMSMLINVDELAEIETINFSQLPSPHLMPKDLINLRKIIMDLLEREDIAGVVVTHGTDSLEETAYYLDLSINDSKPIVITAAMRNASELGYDGPANLAAAILVASSESSRDKGVLIVLNNEVNTARETTKTHTMSLDTFKSIEFGPLGIVDNNEVLYYRNVQKHQHIITDKLETEIHLIKTVLGIDDKLINYLIEENAKGFVIEAMGRGNVPPKMVKGIIKAIKLNIPVVIVSRCPAGRVLDTYGYDGGGQQLRIAGAIMGSNLNGQKARIKLMLARALTAEIAMIKNLFEADFN